MLFSQLFVNLCVLVTLTFLGSQLYSLVRPGKLQRLLLLCAAALAGLIMLQYSVVLEPGIRVDLRGVPVAVSGLLGGPLAALLVALPTALYRLWLGGAGATSAVLLLALIALISGAFHSVFRHGRTVLPVRQGGLVLLTFAVAHLSILTVPERGLPLFLMLYWPLTLCCTLGTCISLQILFNKRRSLDRLEQYRQQAYLDPLTSLGNRRRLEVDSQKLLSVDEQKDSALVLLDIDHFKAVNDTYGHPMGDRVLQQVAQGLRRHLSGKDGIYRYGGEEFALVLHDCTPEIAHQVTERVRRAVSQEVQQATGLDLTLSAGVAVFAVNLSDSLATADTRLYQAKTEGRNRTVSVTGRDQAERSQLPSVTPVSAHPSDLGKTLN